MAANAFMNFFGQADGESTQKGKEKWIEIQGWDWSIEAPSSWTRGGGASVAKPNPSAMTWTHNFDPAAIMIMGNICTGRSFAKVELQMVKPGARSTPETYFSALMEGVFITKVSLAGVEAGGVTQHVEMVFKTIKIDYKQQDASGKVAVVKTFTWDIPAGTASPSV